MSDNPFDLHEERLATTDAQGHRVYLYPEDVKGKWRNRRNLVYYFLIALYLILPWVNIGGKQAILLDIVKREFTFFGMTFYSHNAPILIFVFLGFVFSIGFITSIWGRVWCGWACPQTVFIDAIYQKIEILVEGNARKRMKLDKAPWSAEKIIKKIIKWTLFTVASMHIAHSFIGYFVGARELIDITLQSPFKNLTLFGATWTTTAIILFDFGWFKEQFCLIACPYGRFQSVMMDQSSMIIAYDYNRGEPRRKKGQAKDEHADCIDCFACVKACPTGIDIRRGTQLECIACTNCIDACDDIMRRVGKPEGLIRYDSELALEGKKVKHLNMRNLIYLLVCLSMLAGLIYNLTKITDLDVVLLRGSKTPYTISRTEHTETVNNHFKVVFDYRGSEFESVFLEVTDSDNVQLVTPKNPVPLKDGMTHTNVFMRFKKDHLKKGTLKVFMRVLHPKTKKLIKQVEVTLVGPTN
ncbi:cytochrome c oxidase accessory protein CcoG [Halobacteriovorax sp. HLS]|uniref:cytochrome c oxidase accessory protein CcoG n=1 Tax=Halobacteriovorax sp. HLS TaxID=2234000 RepID=UPI000FD798C8|nr:cytochrome c oxidase accessory protein CcoG [Halobacteriovorax sp. HLS]